jgi:hypothetical protein
VLIRVKGAAWGGSEDTEAAMVNLEAANTEDMGEEGKDWERVQFGGEEYVVSNNLPLEVFAESMGVRKEVITALEVAGFILPPDKRDDKGEPVYDENDVMIVDAWLRNWTDDAVSSQLKARKSRG